MVLACREGRGYFCNTSLAQVTRKMEAPRLARPPLELRAFIDGVPALAWSALPDGSPEFVNQRFPDYSGLPPAEALAQWKSALHPDDAEAFERWWGALQEHRGPGQMEARLRRADGAFRWFQISA